MAVEEDLGRHRHLAGGLCPECLFQNVDDVAHPGAEGVEIGFGNALRLKRFRDEIDDGQPAASMAMLDTRPGGRPTHPGTDRLAAGLR